MELARQNGGVLHDLAHVGAPLDPRYIMRDIFGIEDEEHVHVFPLVGEQILRPLDQVQAEVHAVGGARFDLRREGVITDAVGFVLVLREVGNDEELGPLEARAGQRLELQRPYLVLALTVDTGAHKPELGLDLQKHVADHVAGEAVFAVPAVAAFEGVVAHEPEYARLRRNLAVVVFELDVPRDAPARDVVVALRRAGARLAAAARRRLREAYRVGDESAVVQPRYLVDDGHRRGARQEGTE